MNKVIVNGNVAVLYSPGFGAGWTTWGAPEEMLFDPEIVGLVQASQHDKIEEALKARGYDFCMLGAEDLEIRWLPMGTLFQVNEYDGSESIQLREHDGWKIA